MMRIRLLLPLVGSLIFLLPLRVISQAVLPAAGKWSVGVGLVAARPSVIDKSFSAIPYTGTIGGGEAVAGYEKGRWSQQVEFLYMQGSLKTDRATNAPMTYTYMNGDYSALYAILPSGDGGFGLKGGGSVDLLYDRRAYTDLINTDRLTAWAASLSASAEVSWHFKNGLRGLAITGRWILPLASVVEQPAFGNKEARNNSIQGFSSFLRVRDRIALEKELPGGGRLSLSYRWDYYRMRDQGDIREAAHALELLYSFTF